MRDVDAVGRRAVHLVDAVAQLLHPQRPPQRQRVADRAGFDVRRDDGRRRAGERSGQRVNPVGVHAVIVGYEDSGKSSKRSDRVG